jgi:NNMT/PNMT/TEMT family
MPVPRSPAGSRAVALDRPAAAGRHRALSAWVITLAATAASTYALDAVATAAGVLLVATELLSGLDHSLALAILVGSYVVWGVSLRANLGANWLLLRRTGTSTNVVSKAAFELARRRGSRTQWVAAGAGYVATEIAKEAPYYAGAFGAAVLTESVSSTEALLFLAGANLGAAGYEYVLARLTRGLLGGSRCASFDTDWVPQQYLADYYTVVEPDERETIAFFADAIKQAPADQPVLIFGSGPALHHVFLAAPHASELHLADYLPANLEEIERWCARDPAAKVDEHDMQRVLSPGFTPLVHVRDLPEHERQGYSGVVLVSARRQGKGLLPARRSAHAGAEGRPA